MSAPITFLMILHNHQPVGNFDWVFKNAAEDAYIPFLDVLERHPGICAGLHTTGPLLEWFEANRPDYLERVKGLVAAGRLEPLGGAFYEPIISILPDCDKSGQIALMNEWVEGRFGQRPRGAWLAERIWEPGLASTVGRSGIQYTTLDNTHFQCAGIPDDAIWGSYVTEDQGIPLRVLPIDYQLRYLIPFHDPQETIDYLGALREKGVTAVTYADDGEKFGVWPGTKQWVYTEGWLDRFFDALERNSDWIRVALPGDYVDATPPKSTVYLPTASYAEMMEWALPVKAQKAMEDATAQFREDTRYPALKPFVRGGFWRNFLAKYPESNALYRRMLLASEVLEAARRKTCHAEAVRDLYRAQCNCGYWHGVFGGLYLNFLRRAIYEHLLMAERCIRTGKPAITMRDCDGDGRDEAVLENDNLKCFIAPHEGGAMYECDYYPRAFNLMDTMTRREEAYHRHIDPRPLSEGEHASIHDGVRAKDPDVLKYLVYDPYRRLSFVDHVLPVGETLDAFRQVKHAELGDFAGAPYTVLKPNDIPSPTLVLYREGTVTHGGRVQPVRVGKRFSLPRKGGSVTATYDVDGFWGDLFFGVELNLGLQSGNDATALLDIPGRTLADPRLGSSGEEPDVTSIGFTIGWMPLKLRLSFSAPALLWWFPIETVSLSEGGVERNYQNTCLLPLWRVPAGGNPLSLSLTLEVES